MVKRLLSFLFFSFFFFCIQQKTEAQPNNFQCTPFHIGILPQAPPCFSSNGNNYSTPLTFYGTTKNATNDSLSGAITSCYSNFSVPLHDVWYEFIASETQVEISIVGSGPFPLTNPYIAIYESSTNECVGLIPRGCFSATGSSIQLMEFGPLAFGQKYYLQIASTTIYGNGGFTFEVRSKNKCSDCLKKSALSAFPLPVQASYPPDTTINFCYTVFGYKEQFGNRLHGIVPVLGTGWDAATFTVLQTATSADNLGEWKWFNNLNVNGNNVSGFFYDTGNDNNPVNNLGDQGGLTHLWKFCFKIKTQTLNFCNTSSDDLSIRFLTFSDGESGSLITTRDCSGDKDYVFDAHMNCCAKPYAVYPTAASCNNTTNGKIDVYGGNSMSGYQIYLYNDKGLLIDFFTTSFMNQNHYIKNNLPEGNYYLYSNENTANACQSALNIYVPGPFNYSIYQTAFSCGPGSCLNNAQIEFTGGTPQTIAWNGMITNNPISPPLCPGWNHVTLTTASGTCTIADSVLLVNLPFANPRFVYNKLAYCTSDSFAVINNFPATTGGIFSIVQSNTGITSIEPGSGTVNLIGATSSGSVIIKYSVSAPCQAFFVDTIFVEISPEKSNYPNYTICPGAPNPIFTNNTSNYFNWFSDFGLTILDATQMPGESYDPFYGILPVPGTYIYYVTTMSSTSSNCESLSQQISISIDESKGCGLIIYHGLTPNGDNYNDFWQIDGIANDPENMVSIFNRWGEKIWETLQYDNEGNRWEGKDLMGKMVVDATYFYIINYKDSTFKGWVELTR